MIGVVRSPQVRALLLASLISTAGDQLARVALTVLVFERTGSTLLSGFTYASTFLPALVGAPLLGGLADRHSRKRVLVTADLVRAALLCVLAVPGLPIAAALGVVVVVTLVECPFDAARAALLPQLTGDQYQPALALDRAVQQAAQVLGFAVSGVVLVALSPSTALLLDGLTFAASALFLAVRLAPQQAADPHRRQRSLRRQVRADVRSAWRTVLGDPQTRRPVLFVWLTCAAACVPEGLAAPYAHGLGRGPGAVAVLMAANPVGNVVGGLLLARTPAPRATRLLLPLSLLVTLPLAVCLLNPPFLLLVALVGLSGAGMGLSVLARGLFVVRVPDVTRGRAFALAATGITVSQGIAVGLSAAAAELVSPAAVVGMAGVLGAFAAVSLHQLHPATPRELGRVVPLPAARERPLAAAETA